MIKKYKYQNTNYYMIQMSFHDKLGKRHQPKIRKTPSGERITSERVARMLEAELLNQLRSAANGEFTYASFSDWQERFILQAQQTLKRSTVCQYDGDLKKWLSPSFAKLPVKQITRNDVWELLHEWMPERGATQNTQHRILKTLRVIFEAAIRDGILPSNPCGSIKFKKMHKEKKALNSVEVDLLLASAKSSEHPFYYHWATALQTGMRNGELFALRWTNIDFVNGFITVSASWSNKDGYHSTKSGDTRKVPISEDLKQLLLELKNLGPFSGKFTSLNPNVPTLELDDLVLPRNSEWQHGSQAQILKKYCASIGITPITFHDLRATFITNLMVGGATVPLIMSVVGHKQISTTNVYLRLAAVETKGLTERLSYKLPEASSNNVTHLFA